MNTPIMLALLTLVTGGILRFLWKFASSNQAYGPSFMLSQEIGFCLVFVVAHLVQKQPFDLSPRFTGVGILGGVLAGIGTLALYRGLRMGGQGSVLFPIAALTMIVSVPLTFMVYREPVTTTKLLGLGLGIGSIIFLTR